MQARNGIKPSRKHGIDGYAVFVDGKEIELSWRYSETGTRIWLADQQRKLKHS